MATITPNFPTLEETMNIPLLSNDTPGIDIIYNGTEFADNISTFELSDVYPPGYNFQIQGLGGDDVISLVNFGRVGYDLAFGGDGDDIGGVGVALAQTQAQAQPFGVFFGGYGTDQLIVWDDNTLSAGFTRDVYPDATAFQIQHQDGSFMKVGVGDDVESIAIPIGTSGNYDYYLTEDIAKGIIRTVSEDELLYRTTGANADWYLNGIRTSYPPTPGAGPQPGNPVHRLYNSSQGKHLFSSNEYEIDFLTSGGTWQDEGVIYNAPDVATADVFRFYIPSEGRHFYTALESERDFIIGNQETFSGWKYEGAAFSAYSTSDYPDDAVAVIRYLNQETGSHVYSTSAYEQSLLDQNSNWMNEGIAWFGDPMVVA